MKVDYDARKDEYDITVKFKNQKHGVWVFVAEFLVFFIMMWFFAAQNGMGQVVEITPYDDAYITGVSLDDRSDTAYSNYNFIESPKYTVVDSIMHEVQVCDTVEIMDKHYEYYGSSTNVRDSFYTKHYRIECHKEKVVDSVIIKMSKAQWDEWKKCIPSIQYWDGIFIDTSYVDTLISGSGSNVITW